MVQLKSGAQTTKTNGQFFVLFQKLFGKKNILNIPSFNLSFSLNPNLPSTYCSPKGKHVNFSSPHVMQPSKVVRFSFSVNVALYKRIVHHHNCRLRGFSRQSCSPGCYMRLLELQFAVASNFCISLE